MGKPDICEYGCDAMWNTQCHQWCAHEKKKVYSEINQACRPKFQLLTNTRDGRTH